MKKLSLYMGFAFLGLLMGATSTFAQAVKTSTTQGKTKTPANNTEMKATPTGTQRNTETESKAKMQQSVDQSNQGQKSTLAAPATPSKTRVLVETKKEAQPANAKAK